MIHNRTNQTELSGFYIIYEGSTNLEKKGIYGISHLLEHLKCKCIDDLMDSFQEDGITWNAYTSSNRVVFYFTGLEEFLSPYRDVIIERFNLPFESYVTQEELDKEIKIVIKEYNQSFNSPDEVFYQNHMRRRYSSYSPIGLREDIENITYQDCLDFYDIQYKNPDCIINISRDFEYVNSEMVFEDRRDSYRDDWKADDTIEIEPPIETEQTVEVFYEQIIDFKDIPYVSLLNSMLCSGLNSPFYQEIREKRTLCYGISNYISELGKTPILMTVVSTSPENLDELEDGINEILNNKEIYLDSKRLEVVRKSSIISKKKSLINRHNNISDIIDPNVSIYYDMIESVTLEELYEVYDKYFTLDKFEKYTDKDALV